MTEYQQTAHNEETYSPAIDLRTLLDNLWRALERFWWIVLALGLLSGAVFWWRAYSSYTPYYQTTSTFMVEADIGDAYSSSYYDSMTARQMQAVFPYVLQSNLLNSAMLEELQMSYIPATIASSVAEQSNMITITVTSGDPDDAYRVAEAFLNSYPDAVERIVGTTKMTLIDPPSRAEQPINPRNPFDGLLRGILLGIGAGAVILFCLALTKKTIQHTSDIAKQTNLECLGEVYRVVRKKRRNMEQARFTIRSRQADYSFKETFRSLSVRLERFLKENHAKVLLITSTMPGEGKTTIAVNTALALAANGSRVVLVDGDLRRPTVRTQLGIREEGAGAAEVLQGKCSLNDTLYKVKGTSLLLLAGSNPDEAAAELSGSSKMEELLQLLREGADYVLIDSPPSGFMADAASVSEYADCALYVIRQNYSPSRAVFQTLRHLSQRGTVFAGYVLNDVQSGITETVSRYGYGYGYGYGRYYGKYGGYYSYGAQKEDNQSDAVAKTGYYSEDNE